jgi:hypothetical protein
MQNFQSRAHAIFYIRLRQILIKSAAFLVIWYPNFPSYVLYISNNFIMQTAPRNIEKFSFSVQKIQVLLGYDKCGA